MQYMWIKTGEHAGVPEYSKVPICNAEIASTPQIEQGLLDRGYVEVEFKHDLTMPLNRLFYEPGYPKMMAKISSGKPS